MMRKLEPIVVDRHVCHDYSRSSKLEWLETNGTGGFAMGTVAGANTRRYHGLLVASLHPPIDRHVVLAKLEEAVDFDGMRVSLSVNQYPGAVHPDGHTRIVSFRLDPYPTWLFEVAPGFTIEKRLFLVRGEQTVVIRYRASRACHLHVSPMLACRDYHGIARARPIAASPFRRESGALHAQPFADFPAVTFTHGAGRFHEDGCWHFAVEYLEELERGLDFREDLYKLGTIELDVPAGGTSFVAATIGGRAPRDEADASAAEARERAMRASRFQDPFVARLDAAADQFLVHRHDGSLSAIAGYPWFTDWGRDTMIALPGLLVSRGRLGDAADVMRGLLRHLDRGILPNRFADARGTEPEYNTVDASLWLFQAAHRYLAAGGDRAFLRDDFWPAGQAILTAYRAGTHHGIHVDPEDELVVAGGEGTQLTWMDARVDGKVVTPRHGKPVEINALYYDALKLMESWGRLLGETRASREYGALAARVSASFERVFWNAARGCLFDVVRPERADGSLRPNQLFAMAIQHPLLSHAQQRSVLRVVEEELVTHVGLRTLGRNEPGYRPRYHGGPAERDAAYHQGVVWPWLMGPFIRAYLRVYGRSPHHRAYCQSLLRGLELHLGEGCLGTVGEIFEAEAPYRAVGAPAQAWSVAELLDVLLTDLCPWEAPAKETPCAAIISPSI
jgi:predicted glycogen debranching enzyme